MIDRPARGAARRQRDQRRPSPPRRRGRAPDALREERPTSCARSKSASGTRRRRRRCWGSIARPLQQDQRFGIGDADELTTPLSSPDPEAGARAGLGPQRPPHTAVPALRDRANGADNSGQPRTGAPQTPGAGHLPRPFCLPVSAPRRAGRGRWASASVSAPASPHAVRDPSRVDLMGLTNDQQELALTVLNESGCRCGCGMTVAQCRVEDQSCPRSPLLARAIVDAVRRGGDAAAVRSAYRRAAGLEEPTAATPPAGAEGARNLKGPPSRGEANAPVTLVEYSDFECAYCRAAQAVVKEVLQENAATVRRVFRHFPLPNHANARAAALAAEAARQQGKFWEMHDRLFADPPASTRAACGSTPEHRTRPPAVRQGDGKRRDRLRVDRDIAEGIATRSPGHPRFSSTGSGPPTTTSPPSGARSARRSPRPPRRSRDHSGPAPGPWRRP